MKIFAKFPSGLKGIGLALGVQIAVAGLVAWGIRHQWQQTNSAINSLSELADPSPYRAALLGSLGKIHVAMQGYLLSADEALATQVSKGGKEFSASLPEFKKQNPKLFPERAMDEINRSFSDYQQAILNTFDADDRRQSIREKLEGNFSQMIAFVSQQIRPLIRGGQADWEERRDLALNIENQSRAWHQNVVKAWASLTPDAISLTYENDSRGSSYLDQYAKLQLLDRERRVLKSVRALWRENSSASREAFAMEKVVRDAQTFMGAQRELVIRDINTHLPAMSPMELEAQKQRFILNVRLHGIFSVLLGLAGAISIYFFIGAVGSAWRRRPGKSKSKLISRDGPTMKMSLKGVITGWSEAAEELYQYNQEEILGESIAKLFESEGDIERLSKELSKAAKASFESMHKAKDGMLYKVQIDFHPITDASGKVVSVSLHITKK